MGARLPRVLLRQPNLKDVDATGADLSGGRMDGGWDGSVKSLRLDRANLSDFRFECGITISDGCPLQGEMSLSGANLTGASLATYFRFDGWGGTRIDRTELGLHQLAEIGSSDIRNPILLRGRDARIEISPAEYRELLPHLREPWQLSEAAAPNAPPAWAVPGSIALFVDTPTYFDEPFRATRLYARLLPALVGAAYSRVAVRVNRDGSIDAGGEAIGGNAHLCNLAGEGLRFDPSNGWYSGPFDARPEDPPEWSRGQIPVLKMVGDGAEVYRAGVGIAPEDPRPSQYASCGARATFLPMVRIAGHEEEARRLMEDAGRP